MFFLSRLHCHTAIGLSSHEKKRKTLKQYKIKNRSKYQDNWNQVKIMHKFGKMDCHLHATVPVPCNSKYSMLMSLMMNILFTQKIQCFTIYKNISGQLCRKTNSEPFLFWFGGNELGQWERCCHVFSIARIGGCRKQKIK